MCLALMPLSRWEYAPRGADSQPGTRVLLYAATKAGRHCSGALRNDAAHAVLGQADLTAPPRTTKPTVTQMVTLTHLSSNQTATQLLPTHATAAHPPNCHPPTTTRPPLAL